jgi:hypothetical protein
LLQGKERPGVTEAESVSSAARLTEVRCAGRALRARWGAEVL